MWSLKVDQLDTPEWFDAERVREDLAGRVSRMFVDSERSMLLSGCYILLPGADVRRVHGSRIYRMCGDARIWKCVDTRIDVMGDESMISSGMKLSVNAMTRTSSINGLSETSRVAYMRQSARIGGLNSGVVGRMEDSASIGDIVGSAQVVTMTDNATIRCMDGSSRVVNMRGNTSIDRMLNDAHVQFMCQQASVGRMEDSARVWRMFGTASVNRMEGSSRVELMNDSAMVHVMCQQSVAPRLPSKDERATTRLS